MKVTRTLGGGSVTLNAKNDVWASYRHIAGRVGMPKRDVFLAGVGLPDGRSVLLSVNRESGLILINIVDKDGKGGVEIVRTKASNIPDSNTPEDE